mgnify:CR=1 FL=1
MNIAGFEKIAQYLTHPLVLVGFVLMLAYGIHWQLMKSGLLSQVTKKSMALTASGAPCYPKKSLTGITVSVTPTCNPHHCAV